MITSVTNDRCYELRGLSTETKPLIYKGMPIGNGSIYLEMDTSKVFIFDEENKVWYELKYSN